MQILRIKQIKKMLGIEGIQKECDRCPHVEKPQKEQNAKQNKATH